ncbi:MAG: carbon-nitrogen hydrolase family protein [Betaproteobacteria bacterium]|nr:carbon-nitrogen hydrolase family protein [Betaproteobacteria bacterium]
MGDRLQVFKAAAVQASAVFLDREASVAKACSLIEEAGKNGAQLIVLPEVFIPGGPYWAWHLPMREGLRFSAELYQNSVDIPSDATARLGAAARRAGAYVVIGVNERSGTTIYNTLIFFDREGRIFGKHRKFKGTGSEKLVWGDGDGSTHKVYDTEVGRLGGLICGEHMMVLPGYTLAAMGEQVHVAAWVGFASSDIFDTEICSRYHALTYNTHVICSQSVVDPSIRKKLGVDTIKLGNAWSGIIEGGTGKMIAGPIAPDQEGILYGEIDLNRAVPHYFMRDAAGHYRPKQFQVYFDDRESNAVNVEHAGDGAQPDKGSAPEARIASKTAIE